jgi:hypothetical protein
VFASFSMATFGSGASSSLNTSFAVAPSGSGTRNAKCARPAPAANTATNPATSIRFMASSPSKAGESCPRVESYDQV